MTQKGTVLPDTPEWDYLVAEGIKKDAERNWFLGDAALCICPMGQDGVKNGHYANLRLYADQVGVGFDKIIRCREASSSWDATIRMVGSSWTVHYILNANQDLIKPGMKVAEARALVAERNKPNPKNPEPNNHETKSKPEPKPNLDPEDFKPRPRNQEPETNDTQQEAIFKSGFAGAVNRIDSASISWGKLTRHSPELIAWAKARIEEMRETISMFEMVVNSDEDSIDSELTRLFGES